MSVVVPVHNEAAGLEAFHQSLVASIEQAITTGYEIIYVDDGSQDRTPQLVRAWHGKSVHTKLLRLSRNFGKEAALTAGINASRGRAVLLIDGDGQHPVDMIPQFVSAWQAGARVVVGVRRGKRARGWSKRVGAQLFYRLFNRMTEQQLQPGATDFRLIDRGVQQAFLQLGETERITRGLIDWLGFKPHYIEFRERPREAGQAANSLPKLFGLAANSFVSLSPKPLYWFGYLGVFITVAAFLLGTTVFIEQLLLDDPLHWKFTGTAMLAILILFLIGIVLLSQGMLSLYISHIHHQTKGRPLYVIDYTESAGIDNDET